MRSNKINNVDLFTSAANANFSKHIKKQNKQSLEIIKAKIDWEKLIPPSSKRDKDADFTKKRGKTYYGYKGHIAIDEDSEIIKRVEFTSASIHDFNEFDQLVDLFGRISIC